MGGRGASSGKSIWGRKYGSQYHTVIQADNVKFVQKNSRKSESLLETMTPGRVYAEVGGKDLLRIIFFDSENKRNRVIEHDKRNNTWHVHEGYYHTEYSDNEHEDLTERDKKILARVRSIWDNQNKA